MQNDRPNPELYAAALIALGDAAGCLPEIERDVGRTQDVLSGDVQIQRFVADPAVTLEGKRKALGELLEGKVHRVYLYFVFTLLEQGVLRHVGPIAEAFFERLSARRDHECGELVTAATLSSERLACMEREVGRILGKKIKLRVQVDSAMLGGTRITVGDFVFDGTVDRQLESMQQTLLS